MTYKQLAKRLRAEGCQLKRQSKGSHEIWHNPKINRSAVVPRHAGDMPVGTLKAILKQLGIRED
jgi:predicted RNA binding protein YcfA (HicA-like mRNA interferase family)